ncbi:hypothetical protein BT69DRAFT_1338196 [Atractiella rhizophila]|nr:hypothetical protein BT69DRAFT_1338196 [Atractiella rhizophila]
MDPQWNRLLPEALEEEEASEPNEEEDMTPKMDYYSQREQRQSLEPARVIAASGIKPVLVFMEHALAYAHFVPTATFDLYLLIPDQMLSDAADALRASNLPLIEVGCEDRTIIRKDLIIVDDGVPRPIRFQRTDGKLPPWICLIPSSAFKFELSSETMMKIACCEKDDGVYFPTFAAFFDSMISSQYLEDTNYYAVQHKHQIRDMINYFLLYYARELCEDTDNFRAAVKPESAQFMCDLLQREMRRIEASSSQADNLSGPHLQKSIRHYHSENQ